MIESIRSMNGPAGILFSLAIILLAGFLMTRLTKLAKLPNVTGYILAGVIIGPHVLRLIPVNIIDGMGFISDIALAFIAFGVGRFFKREAFRQPGPVLVITLLESLAPMFLITLSMRLIFRLDWEFSLLLGAIATATAPASTMVTIRQYKAKGNFVYTLLQVVAFDDAVCLVLFSIVAAVISAKHARTLSFKEVILPVVFNILVLFLGFGGGFVLSRLMTPARSEDNRLILTVAMLLGISGLCATLGISPLLACMLLGTTYINLTKDKELYDQVNKFTPPILSIFFVVSGMNLDITSFKTLGLIGTFYFVIRIIGKYLGAYLGALSVKAEKPIRNYLGLALVPQAGVAIGLAFLAERILPPEVGGMLLTIILSSSVLYEMVGPVSAKVALIKSGSIPEDMLPKRERKDKKSHASIKVNGKTKKNTSKAV
mgnify:CR=1 FL=1